MQRRTSAPCGCRAAVASAPAKSSHQSRNQSFDGQTLPTRQTDIPCILRIPWLARASLYNSPLPIPETPRLSWRAASPQLSGAPVVAMRGELVEVEGVVLQRRPSEARRVCRRRHGEHGEFTETGSLSKRSARIHIQYFLRVTVPPPNHRVSAAGRYSPSNSWHRRCR